MKSDLENNLAKSIFTYVDISHRIENDNYLPQDVCLQHLDLWVFRMCIIHGIPIECMTEDSDFVDKLERFLWEGFIEREEKSTGSHNEIKIAGYLASKEQVSSFSAYSLMLYCHILKDYSKDNREEFLKVMILYPCYRKINQLPAENRKIILDYLELEESSLNTDVNKRQELAEETKKIVQRFDYWKNRMRYEEYVTDVEEIVRNRTAAKEGVGLYYPKQEEERYV